MHSFLSFFFFCNQERVIFESVYLVTRDDALPDTSHPFDTNIFHTLNTAGSKFGFKRQKTGSQLGSTEPHFRGDFVCAQAIFITYFFGVLDKTIQKVMSD